MLLDIEMLMMSTNADIKSLTFIVHTRVCVRDRGKGERAFGDKGQPNSGTEQGTVGQGKGRRIGQLRGHVSPWCPALCAFLHLGLARVLHQFCLQAHLES